MKKILAIVTLLTTSAFSSAAVVEFGDFSDVSNLQLNGSATTTGNDLTLTNGLSQSGSAFLQNSVMLNPQSSFSAFFEFRISNPSGVSDPDGQGADGLVFVVQTLNNTAGGSGGGIGYQGIMNSVGVEFDTWNNGGIDGSNGNHVGINLGGDINSAVRFNEPTRFNNGGVWSVWIDYNGVTDLMSVRYTMGGSRPLLSQLDLTVDLTAQLGQQNAFFGFTSGTGAAGGKHDILNARFSNDFTPFDVSESGTVGIMLMGLAFLGFRKYKAQK